MKEASEVLDGDFLRRIILPGAVAASYAHPYLRSWLVPMTHKQYGLEVGLVLLAEAVFFGLLVSSATVPIFQVYEGFRLRRLTRCAEWWNRKRLKKLEAAYMALNAPGHKLTEEEKNKSSKLFEGLSDYLIVESEGKAEYTVERPTLLGNIMATYELYPKTRYGVNGVAFWNHLLSLAPESARKSFEENVTFADSMVLTSATGALVLLVALCSMLGRLIGTISGLAIIKVSLPVGVDIGGFLGGVATWFLFYQLSLPAHRKVRYVFQALTDLTMPKFVRYINAFDVKKATGAAAKAEE
ncbi:MAG: hypothetical protein JF614_26005, partial [Acidobacteria bacterium]|nr:hypothetical protein [Acidobacteriota bacterium]